MTREEKITSLKHLFMGGTSFEEVLKEAMDFADEHHQWRSVDDALPKDGQYVATINTVEVKDVRHYSHGKWYSNFGNEYDDITHWMPLPQPPKEGGEK